MVASVRLSATKAHASIARYSTAGGGTLRNRPGVIDWTGTQERAQSPSATQADVYALGSSGEQQ
jgi:hypothetical protein